MRTEEAVEAESCFACVSMRFIDDVMMSSMSPGRKTKTPHSDGVDFRGGTFQRCLFQCCVADVVLHRMGDVCHIDAKQQSSFGRHRMDDGA